MAIVAFITKTPTSEFVIGLDFTTELPDGVTLSTGVASARNRKTEEDVTGVLLSDTDVTVDAAANTGKVAIQGGEMGVWYEVLFQMTLSNGHTLPGKYVIFVDL